MTRHPGRLWAVPHYRVSPVALACGLFRIDGSGDEYGGGVCGGFDFGWGPSRSRSCKAASLFLLSGRLRAE